MAKIKEIRVKYDLDNEDDRVVYEKLTMNTSQPGRIVKSIVKENIDNDFIKVKSNLSETDYTKELLKVIKNLSDKLDNLTVVSTQDKEKEVKEDYIPTASINVGETDDIDF